MRKPKRKAEPLELPPMHPRYEPFKPLLQELVFVEITTNLREHFSVLLTRVPSIGEEIAIEANYFKVNHTTVDDDGRTFGGYHAYIDAELRSQEPLTPRKRKT